MQLVTFCTLQSGSNANACYIGTGQGAVLIDCGLSYKALVKLMESAGLDPACLRAVLVTHEHSDHIKGVGVLSRKLHIPIYATEGTWMGIERTVGCIASECRVVVRAGESFFLPGFEAVPFAISHDAREPVGYRLYGDTASVAIATDTGYISQEIRSAIIGADLVLLESNHDPEMLKQNSNYSQQLKTRILGRKGHLSNETCSRMAVELLKSGTKHIVLGHLSEENNTPLLAETIIRDALLETGAEENIDFTLHVAPRYAPDRIYQL